MISIANPIYDSVFKYLMEDERITKTILSALLKKDVVEVEMRKHEYSNGSRDKISMFRLDFAAKVRQEDGTLKLILIELQKTWLETETLRFRQYLGTQYSDPANIIKGDNMDRYAIPMVTVYMLGHRVGDIEEPVLYVRRHSYDYNDNLVTKGLPNPFIDSLTHDSIIVQIPRLHGQVNNRVEKVLSIFDQSQMDGPNKQVLNIDESLYADDADMLHIVHRLMAAASDSKMRHEMNVEDEYYSVIEKRDTTIMMKDRQIAQQNATILEQGATIQEQGATIQEQGATIQEQGATIQEQGATIQEQGATIQEQGATIQEQGAMLRSTIKLLINAGMTPELIAANLGVPIETVTRHMD